MTKNDYYKYMIGDYVEVKATVIPKYIKHGIRILARTEKLQRGKITGIKKMFTGKVNYDFEDRCFEQNECIAVWEIRAGLLNKPIYALDKDVIKCERHQPFPLLAANSYKWSEQDKRNLSEDSKNWPRDEKGRWCKTVLSKI